MNPERILKIIRSPYMSEKAAIGTEKRREYVFEVSPDAVKPEVKEAVESLFQAKVQAVRIVNVKSKSKQFRQRSGKTKSWKKAYVTLQPDQKIDFAGMK